MHKSTWAGMLLRLFQPHTIFVNSTYLLWHVAEVSCILQSIYCFSGEWRWWSWSRPDTLTGCTRPCLKCEEDCVWEFIQGMSEWCGLICIMGTMTGQSWCTQNYCYPISHWLVIIQPWLNWFNEILDSNSSVYMFFIYDSVNVWVMSNLHFSSIVFQQKTIKLIDENLERPNFCVYLWLWDLVTFLSIVLS
jgi:hypothetical protein